MRVLLIKARSLRPKVLARTPPMGVLGLASYLRKYLGAEVRVADVFLMSDPAREIADVVRDFQPHMVGISALTCEAFMLHQAAAIVRSVLPQVPVVTGGPYPSSDPQRVLSDWNVDVAVIGEGEETLLELAKTIRDEGPAWRSSNVCRRVAGIVWRDPDGVMVRNPPRPLMEDLDSLPPPAWDAIDVRWFWKQRGMSTGGIRPYLPVLSSRGCPFRCTYCHNLFGRKFRARSAESVVQEIADIMSSFGIRDIEFYDDSINLDRVRFKAILTGLLERGLHPRLSFPNALRGDFLDEETVHLIQRVGAGEISVAVESASPRIQALSRKRLDLAKVTRMVDLMAGLRMFTRGFFMLGYPTETEQEILETIEYAATSRLHIASFHIANPFPGTAMHDEFVRLGKLPDNVNTNEYEYTGAPFNGSEVPEERFRWLVRWAFFRFYTVPERIGRIIRDRPYWSGYDMDLMSLLGKFVAFRRVTETLRP